jgi:rubrerythrin
MVKKSKMAAGMKQGKPSQAEKQKLFDLFAKDLPIDEIAKKLGRRPVIINRWIREFHLDKVNKVPDKIREAERILTELHKKHFWKELKKQFTDPELKYFESDWISLLLQFREDVLPAEEMQIKQLVTISILINRCMAERKKHMEEIERLQKEIVDEYNKDEINRDPAKIANLEQQKAYAQNSIGTYTTEFTKLLSEQKEINKNLKATRDQRIKRIEDSKTTFTGLLKALDDEEIRRRMGDEAELMRLAKDKAKDRLSEYHKYADNILDIPILTPETVLTLDKGDNEDNE